MKIINLKTFLASFLLSCVVASPAFAEGEASKVITETVNTVKTTIVENESKLSPQALDSKLRDIITPVFDFREMSRRSLAKHWKQANETQQKDFTNLFSDLLSRNYLKKIRENAGSSDFSVVGEQKAGNKRVVVKTKIDFDGKDAAIHYRMRLKKDAWKVYDVIIENIGLVSNYRSEFSGIVQKDGIDGLIQKLKEKNQ